MKQWTVEMIGSVREVYIVEAETESEAVEGWADGRLIVSESFDMELASVRLD